MQECPRCGLKFENAKDCPSCGLRMTAEPLSGPGVLVRRYFEDVGRILFHPVQFFRRMPVHGGLARPLAFALVTHWLGAACGYLWKQLTGGGMAASLQRLMFSMQPSEVDHPGRYAQAEIARQRFQEWFAGVGPIVADPFLTLASILVSGAFVYVGARIFVPSDSRQQVTYESAVRILCYGMTPAILAAIPFVGGALSWLGVIVVTVIGAREVYRIPTLRAAVVALFPKLLFIGIILVGVFFFAMLFFQLFFALFAS